MGAPEATIISAAVTGVVAIVAGIGSASLTAWINRKNTKDSLASAQLAAKEQWEQTQQREHALWLRDQKLEAYTEFLAVASALRHDVATRALEEKPNVSVLNLNNNRLRVKVIGAPHIHQLATEIARELMVLIAVQREALADAQSHKVSHAAQQTDDNRRELDLLTESVRKASTEVIVRIGQFVHAIREDLGAATADEAAVGVETKSNTAAA